MILSRPGNGLAGVWAFLFFESRILRRTPSNVTTPKDGHPIIGHYVIGQRARHQSAMACAAAGLT